MASLGEKHLQRLGVTYSVHSYDYRKKGAAAAAEALGLDVAATLKSLVIRLPGPRFIFFLVPGDASLSMRKLARSLGERSAELASERDAERLTGYRVGGMGPFGSRNALPVYVDLSALEHDTVYVNGGRRGLLLGMDPEALVEAAQAEVLDVARLED
ncbi:MAG: Cys-tRNA(Pro) deacylase [Deltaproteobacteria bacterium]|nr:Cys-tRNA(Pro) deacylase [Deltaproteobacteria bacterium]